MGHIKIIVDHEKIDYKGPMNCSELFRLIPNFVMERGFDFRTDKDFEHHTETGTQIEWQASPWKIMAGAEYARHMIKIRILAKDLKKVDVIKDGKKSKLDTGELSVTIDGFIETDIDGRWEQKPFFLFLRTIYDNFIYKIYTERFESRLVHDINQLSHAIKQYLNVCRKFEVVSKSSSKLGL
tara:strand:+ start:264 stop:809 length:546 start_codon:yes stop_codon:yes gene_type:complete